MIKRKQIGINTVDKLYDLTDFEKAYQDAYPDGEIGYHGITNLSTKRNPFVVVHKLLCLGLNENFSQLRSLGDSNNPTGTGVLQAELIAQGEPSPAAYQNFQFINRSKILLTNHSLNLGGLFHLFKE